MTDYLKSAFRNLGRKRVRTALTVLGIAIGVASVILVADISQSGIGAITDEMESLGLSGLTVAASGKAESVSLKEEDLETVKKISQVEQAAPILMANTRVSSRNTDWPAVLWGIDSNADEIISLESLYGRLLNRKDVSTRANVCLVDENFAKKLYFRSNIVGKHLSILCGGSRQDFTVVGIVKTGTGLLQNVIGNYIPTFVYIPYTTAQNSMQREDYDQIAVKVKSGGDAENVGKLIVTRLDSINGTTDAFVSNNLAKQKDGLLHVLNIVSLVLSAVGAVSLLVAGLSIMTVMLVSVRERTREIGIKKALGATRGAIMTEFLFEAVMISLIGCAIGVSAGLLVSLLGAEYFHIPFAARPDLILLAVGFAVLSGTVFGVYPAYQAARLKPADALRQD